MRHNTQAKEKKIQIELEQIMMSTHASESIRGYKIITLCTVQDLTPLNETNAYTWEKE